MARRSQPIHRLANGRYRLRIDAGTHPDGRRRQITRTFDTLREAHQAYSEIQVAARSGTFVGKTRITVREQYESWLAGKRSLRPTTIQHYRDVARPFFALCGDLPVQDLSKTVLDRAVTDLLTTGGSHGKGRSVSFVRTLVIGLGQALDLAVEEGICRTNVARLVELPEMPLPTPLAWTADQSAVFLQAVHGSRIEALWLLTMAGLRRGEVMGLTWRSIDLEGRELRIETTRVNLAGSVIDSLPKTRRGWRSLPIWPELDTAFRNLRRTQAQERLALGGWTTDLLAVLPDGTPMTPRHYADLFKQISSRAGLPVIPLKNARHTSVTLMRNRGVPDHIVATWHGHDENVMRAVYTDSHLAEMNAAADALVRFS